MYKYEMHLHSSECSKCAASTSYEMIDAAKEHGYSGVVFTNHFYGGNTNIDRSLPWKDFVSAYAEDYKKASAYGEKTGIDVLFAFEEGIGKGKEVLIYGIEPNILVETPHIKDMPIAELSNFVRNNGGFIALAHPFRDRSYITDPYEEPNPQYFDGIEIYNHFNTDDENKKAADFAKKYDLIGISGGDIHASSNFGVAGLAFNKRIKTNKELVDALKSRDFKLIIQDKLVEP